MKLLLFGSLLCHCCLFKKVYLHVNTAKVGLEMTSSSASLMLSHVQVHPIAEIKGHGEGYSKWIWE